MLPVTEIGAGLREVASEVTAMPPPVTELFVTVIVWEPSTRLTDTAPPIVESSRSSEAASALDTL